MRRFLIAVSLLPLFAGCATSHLNNWADTEVKNHRPTIHIYADYLRGLMGGPFAVTIAWDLLTLPIQAAMGVHPYGDSLKPDDSRTLTRRLQED